MLTGTRMTTVTTRASAYWNASLSLRWAHRMHDPDGVSKAYRALLSMAMGDDELIGFRANLAIDGLGLTGVVAIEGGNV